MAPEGPDARARAAQTLAMAGVATTMLGCAIGGGVAVVLYLVGQREPAMVIAVVAGLIVAAGVAMQAIGFSRLRRGKGDGR
jgi:hypothetical protein